MYEYIKGTVAELNPAMAVIEAGGVGYSIIISLQTYTSIGSAGEAKLYVHYVVREDAQLLYGFFTKTERDIFRHLIAVSGVGGNTARMILSTFSPDEVASIIMTGQAEVLKSVKGLGLKTAQKIIVELRDKIGGISSSSSLPVSGAANPCYAEALSALTMLGFARSASEKTLSALCKENHSASVEDLIRMALKKM